ncbi:Ig-like domain-containing protein [Faecalicoccus acidiformans]|uniref:Ig-like domain-containing protein n=1 Tax=Faecalicoccus acidiformans TaxID=915173 RepID=A0ABS2FMK6_9FIRM|nr:Ig-like domain-containing protein [Faecalicoccus acidiformans]MBM6831226.1 Ig-like domain-containing protein [Faecalicoccus acidiformans]
MKKTIGRTIIALFTAIILTLSFMPTRVWALNYDTLWIGNTRITDTGYWTSDDGGTTWTSQQTQPGGDSYIYYDVQGTLELHNVTIQGKYDDSNSNFGAGIYARSRTNQSVSLTIQLTGNNTITGDHGIYVDAQQGGTLGANASLSITGDGSLTVTGTASYGLYVKSGTGNASLTIENASVDATSSVSYFSYAGVCVGSSYSATAPALSLAVNGGSLTTSASEGNDGIQFYVGNSSTSATTSLTVSNNAIVRANGGIKASRVDEPTPSGTGIVFDGTEGTVYGNVTLQEDITIGEGESLTIGDGASLNTGSHEVIVNGGTLTGGDKIEGTVKYAPAITTESLPDGTVGEPYTETILAATGDASITWSVSNGSLPAGLSLSENGKIIGTPTTEGTSTFTVTATNNIASDSREFTLKIEKPAFIPVTDLELDKTSLTLQETDSATLIATVDPDNATNKNVNWESSDTSIATVDANGKVTAISAGSATITATAADGSGESASCSVTVTHGNMVHTPKKDATCTADGNEEYWTCETCGNHFSGAEGKTEIELSDTVIPATGHNLIKTEANKATVDASGNIEYWYCSDCEKYFKDEKGEHEITLDETIIAKLPKLLNGANAEWSKGKKEGLTFSVDANISDFIGVKVDQQELDPSMYEVRSGSTIITLKPSYLESLSSGKHEIRMEFKSGTIQTYFTIKKGSDSQTPETGQQTNLYMWIGLLAASALVLGFIGWKRHSK